MHVDHGGDMRPWVLCVFLRNCHIGNPSGLRKKMFQGDCCTRNNSSLTVPDYRHRLCTPYCSPVARL